MASPHPLSAAALFSLKDYVAVGIAQTLAANGAKVYITGRRVDVLETSARVHGAKEKLGPLGGQIVPLAMDITSKDSIRSALAEISGKETYVNVLVNNAGLWTGRTEAKAQDGPEAFSETMFAQNKEEYEKAFDVNCTSQFFVTAAFLPLLAKAASGPTGKIGTVINNSSVTGFTRMSHGNQYPYNISKAAFSHLTRQLAHDLSHENMNIRVNGIAFGYFQSEMTTGPANEENESTDTAGYEKLVELLESYGAPRPKRPGTPQEVATAVLMLVANEFVWGTVMLVDGGLALTVASDM
ncbi:hypothetical protein M426DRAFT_257695 [Hypoxylon sp. CI-4A]|nr:hypothetical protein M426DRAFT_257695 [Hypoxylon sp. CI-4A]